MNVNAFKTRKITHETISPAEYLARREKDPKSVAGAKILPPGFGDRSFGMFVVERERPLYEFCLDGEQE